MKLLIVNNNMHIGGIQKALVNMLKHISDKHDVTLLLLYPQGALMGDIPESVKVITANRFMRVMGMSSGEAKKDGLLTFLWRSGWTVFTRIFGIKPTFGLLSRFGRIDGEYDAAISYMQNSGNRMFYGGCNEIVLNSVKADKKLSFIHCDFRNYFGNNSYNRAIYSRFDRIACVSDSCREAFLEVCPQYTEKAVAVHNFHDFAKMRESASAYLPKLSTDCFNIFTCARISSEKGILRVIPIIARLESAGFKVKWYIAGDGDEGEQAKMLAAEHKASIEFLGMLENPYPYFKGADLVLVPSYNEAAPMVYAEAMCFATPILTTDTTSAHELAASTGGGIVCENTDEGIEKALFGILKGELKAQGASLIPDEINQTAMRELEYLLGDS